MKVFRFSFCLAFLALVAAGCQQAGLPVSCGQLELYRCYRPKGDLLVKLKLQLAELTLSMPVPVVEVREVLRQIEQLEGEIPEEHRGIFRRAHLASLAEKLVELSMQDAELALRHSELLPARERLRALANYLFLELSPEEVRQLSVLEAQVARELLPQLRKQESAVLLRLGATHPRTVGLSRRIVVAEQICRQR
jgi:hypothetical protein